MENNRFSIPIPVNQCRTLYTRNVEMDKKITLRLHVNVSRVYFISTIDAYNTIRNIKSKRNVLVSFVFSSLPSLVQKNKKNDQNKIKQTKHTNGVVFVLRAPDGCSRVYFIKKYSEIKLFRKYHTYACICYVFERLIN